MKVFILLSVLGLAAAQMNIQLPMEWIQPQWNQPQQQWDNSVPVENNWNFRRPAPQPEPQPEQNLWDFRRPAPQPEPQPEVNHWDFRRPAPQPEPQPEQNNWDFRRPLQNFPWNQEPVRVPPQPVETEPWLLRPETRCPQPAENSYHWALIIPHWRDQGSLTLCMGGVGIPFACPSGFVFVQAEQMCVGNYRIVPLNFEEQQ